MTKSGGPAAIKGFRLQTTYLLWRLLEGRELDAFRPEGEEDLDLLDADLRPVEHVQVKAYGGALQFKHLADNDADGDRAEDPYFTRAVRRLRSGGAAERVVTFGPLGPELREAWRGDGPHRERVRKKLRERHFSAEDVDLLFANVTLEEIGEADQRAAVNSLLREGVSAGDVTFAHHALSYWLLEQSEASAVVSVEAFHQQLGGVGRAFVEAAAHRQQWGVTLRPLLPDDVRVTNAEALRQQLFDGVGARPEHILADVDVRREALLKRLDTAFTDHAVVVIRGASGQGKSALAYRYLHDHAVSPFTFAVGRLQDGTQARLVALAVAGRMRALRVPMWLLLDVLPGDAAWLDLLQELSTIENLRVLVTIREEDWTRAQGALGAVPYELVTLAFTPDEARPLFDALARVRPSKQFLTFDEAWRYFEERGPLLEFVFMVTHEGEHLRARLHGQVRALEAAWHLEEAKLDFLHAAALAAAFHARVRTLDLARACGLGARAVKPVVDALEREHLLRVREEDGVIEGLHAIRSGILLELLSSPEVPAAHALPLVLPAIAEDDLEMFLLHALLRLQPSTVLTAAHALTPATWAGRAGVVRALLWWDVREHLNVIMPAVRAAYEEYEFAWWAFLPVDVLGLCARGLVPELPDWATQTYLPERARENIARLRRMVEREEAALANSRAWLTQPRSTPAAPASPLDWAGLAELAFYTGLWNAPEDTFEGVTLDEAAHLPLEEAAEVHYGLTFLHGENTAPARDALRDALFARFKREAPIARVDDDGRTLTLHFPVPVGDDPIATLAGSEYEDAVLDATLRRLNVSQHLFPQRETYASQGYGHQIALLPNLYDLDNSRKAIKREMFPPVWGVRWNATLHRLADLEFLLPDWAAHAQHQLRRRAEAMDGLERMLDGLPKSMKDAEDRGKFWTVRVFVEALQANVRRLESQQILPRSAVDPWGLAVTSASASRRATQLAAVGVLSRRFEARQHDSYLKALRDYGSSLATFFRQAAEGLYALALLRAPQDRNAEWLTRRRQRHKLRGVFLSLLNLREVLERLPTFQAEFRDRFHAHVDAEQLRALEERERAVTERLWDTWGDVARVPNARTRVSQQSGAQVVEKHYARLARELEALRALGVDAQVVPSSESWTGHAPTLWIRMNVAHAAQAHDAHLLVARAVHRVLAPTQAQDWASQVMEHAWHSVAIIPTRAGRPWRPAGWVHPAALLRDEPTQDRWWLLAPTVISAEQLNRLGLPLWPVALPDDYVAVQAKIAEFFWLASSARDLERLRAVENVDSEVLADILTNGEERLEACLRDMRRLLGHQELRVHDVDVLAEQDLPLLFAGDHLWQRDFHGSPLYLVSPSREDYRAANAWLVGALLEVQRLQFEDAAVERLLTEALTIDGEVVRPALPAPEVAQD